jgi:hypothetical protein
LFLVPFETSVLTTATRRNIPEDNILHSRRRENFKSYKEHVGGKRFADEEVETQARQWLIQAFSAAGIGSLWGRFITLGG